MTEQQYIRLLEDLIVEQDDKLTALKRRREADQGRKSWPEVVARLDPAESKRWEKNLAQLEQVLRRMQKDPALVADVPGCSGLFIPEYRQLFRNRRRRDDCRPHRTPGAIPRRSLRGRRSVSRPL